MAAPPPNSRGGSGPPAEPPPDTGDGRERPDDGPRTLLGRDRPLKARPARTTLSNVPAAALAPTGPAQRAEMAKRAEALRAQSRVLDRSGRPEAEPAESRLILRPEGLAAEPPTSRVLTRPEGLAAEPPASRLLARPGEPDTTSVGPAPDRDAAPSAAAAASVSPKAGPKPLGKTEGARPRRPTEELGATSEAIAVQMRIQGRSERRRGVAVEPPAVEEGDEWAISFVDVFTLLLTLFIALMARMQLKTEAVDPEGIAKTEAALVAAEKKVAVSEREIISLKKKVAQSPPAFEFPVGELGNDVEVSRVEGGVQLAISDKILFAPGSAKLKPEGLGVLDSLLRLLMSGRFPVTVEGHTDNMPIATAFFPSNWELSAARASSVVRHLISQGVDDRRLKAIGYADTRPVAGNDTMAGRSKNRRVSLLLTQE